MSTESKIKELEKQLELKKAFLDVKVSFGKGKKYSKEVQDQVRLFVQDACTRAAEGETITQSEAFTEDEINILKNMVNTLQQRSKNPSKPLNPSTEISNSMSNTVSQTIKKITNQNKALILTLDNVDRTVRNKIAPQSVVRVVGKRDDTLMFVETSQGVRFNIPVSDLEFNIEEGELNE